MNRSLVLLYRISLVLLGMIVAWTLWAAAVEPTNAPPVAPAPPLLPALDSGGSALTFGLDRVRFLQHQVFRQPLWKYVASIIYMLLALYSSKLIDWLVTGRLKEWAARTETRFDDLLLEVVHGPVKVVSLVIFLHIGLRLLSWSPWFADYLSKGLRVVVAWSISYMVLKALDLGMDYWRRRNASDEDRLFNDHLFPVIRKTLRVVIIIAAVLLTADNLGFKVTSILAGLSIGGLALGLAAQDTVANLFGAVAVFLDKPFHVGDRIKVESVDGTVEAIGLRSTRVRNLEGHLVTIPNKTMGNAIITNVSLRPTIKTEMVFGLTYDTTPDKIREATRILDELYRQHPMTFDVVVGFTKFADSALNLTVVHWWKSADWKTYVAGMHDLNLEVKSRLEAAGIAFAFPTQTVYLKQDSDWRVAR
jgi:MscS family membrane protein